MTRTHDFVSDLPEGKYDLTTPAGAARAVRQAFALVEGRWKLEILFHLFGGRVQRFSDLERSIDGVSQKMLAQQLRAMERDGLVIRVVFPEVPPRVEYRLTDWAQMLCPALDAHLKWLAAGDPSNRG